MTSLLSSYYPPLRFGKGGGGGNGGLGKLLITCPGVGGFGKLLITSPGVGGLPGGGGGSGTTIVPLSTSFVTITAGVSSTVFLSMVTSSVLLFSLLHDIAPSASVNKKKASIFFIK